MDETTRNNGCDVIPHDLSHDVAELLQPHLTPQSSPGKGDFLAITLEGVAVAATFLNRSPREAMIVLLEAGIWPLRFARNRGVLSARDQAKLLASGAAIIGCGGLGGHVATLLARLGVGSLSLCDYDVFDETNLNRQLLSRESNLGRNKAVVAAEEVKAIASHVEVRVYPVAAAPGNLPEILDGNNVVMDCLDSLAARLQVEASAHALGLPFIHGSVAGEEGFVMISRPGRESLAAILGEGGARGTSGAERLLGVPTLTPAALAVLEVHLARQVLLGEVEVEQILWHLDLAGMQLLPIIV